MSGIQGKVVVITGASSGLGEATARHLAGRGAKVFLGARRTDRLSAVVTDIERSGGEAVAKTTDVTKRADVEALVQAALQKFGRIDVMVNNAGLMATSPIAKLLVEEWERMVDINVKGVLYGIAAALPVFQRLRPLHQHLVGGRPQGQHGLGGVRRHQVRGARDLGRAAAGGRGHPHNDHLARRRPDRAAAGHIGP